jgi:hypothetical protein
LIAARIRHGMDLHLNLSDELGQRNGVVPGALRDARA